MSRIDPLRKNYQRVCGLPWDRNVAGPQRVWVAVYDKEDERKLRLRIGMFEEATLATGHRWHRVDLTDAFADWLCRPDNARLRGELLRVAGTARRRSARRVQGGGRPADRRRHGGRSTSPRTRSWPITGVASLFGFARISQVLPLVEAHVRGRLLVFFPGVYENNNYRLLDARDGWNYLAVPITAQRRGGTRMINREVYEKDPSRNRLLNQGVAKVTSGHSDVRVGDPPLRGRQLRLRRPVRRRAGAHPPQLPRPPGQVRAAGRLGQRVLRQRQEPPGQDAPAPLDRLRVRRRGEGSRGWRSSRRTSRTLLVELSTQAKRKGGLHAAAGTLGAGAGDERPPGTAGPHLPVGGPARRTTPAPRSCCGSGEEGLEEAVREPRRRGGGRLRQGTDQPLRLRPDRQGDPRGTPGLRREARRGQAPAPEAVPRASATSRSTT